MHRRALNESDSDDPLALREKTTDIFIGARYFKTEPRLTLSLPVGDPITTVTTDDRWDPFIGFRTGRDLSKRWGFGVRGDIGGFGIGDAAQFTWQLSASFALRASESTSSWGIEPSVSTPSQAMVTTATEPISCSTGPRSAAGSLSDLLLDTFYD